MKKIAILFWVFALSAGTTLAQVNVPETDEILKRITGLGSTHPRILIGTDEIPRIKRDLSADNVKSRIHRDILSECEVILSLPKLERNLTGRRLLGISRESLRRIFYLSYAYRSTGDTRFLNRAEDEILTVCRFSDWNPSHFLDVGEMTMSVAIGYDWLFGHLTENTRKIAREAIVSKGINPSYDDKVNWFVKATNNWNQVCHAGMVFGALAVSESYPELSAKVIRRAIEFVPSSMQFYAPDGAYPEGYMYWDYGTSFNVLLIDALDHAFGTDFGLSSTTGFIESASYLQHMIGPNLKVHNWGDSSLDAVLSPALFWFAQKSNDPSLLWFQYRIVSDPDRKFVHDRLLPALLIWANTANAREVRPPAENVWKGQGKSPVGLMRSSWTDTDAFFVGFKAGSPSVSHAHMDAGSFVIDAKGERWAMDFGMQYYHSLESRGVNLWDMSQNSERWKVFRYNNFVHNTITVNDRLHNIKGYSKIENSGTGANPFFVTDLTEMFTPDLSESKRGIKLVDKGWVVIRDEIATSEKAARIRWSFLTPASVKMVGDNLVEFSQNGKTMYLIVQGSVPIVLKTWSTKSPNDYDADNGNTTIVGFEADLEANSSNHFEVIFGDKKQAASAQAPLDTW